mmetsp:Transcript_823/g.2356  ORF Transcript_823/g.2356 Transcript_823/m.2356 type:complete len:633 (-) Transcript_823:238-2136(-)|eukprot:CAMPEP_0113525628 /NCGR_PEP_ID=MMETSP0015_2-20120614/273_1 /TAXON_ID=2838 /ORGANISM="Odontella" /LENGTH=632 /DNA_ID=CAMNT_0000423827 /DNA_START=201 /DNA_END=2099 /DNA_ORIENTATION=+ /assembly_acc=CAM_ASM_000160
MRSKIEAGEHLQTVTGSDEEMVESTFDDEETQSSMKRYVASADDERSDNGHGHHDNGNNGWGRGIVKDFKRTIGTHYKEEITNFNFRTIGVSLFIFFAAVSPAITFGAVYGKSTNNNIGAIEMLLATAWCGIVYGFVGGQPMMINGGTGPVLALQTVIFQLSKSMDIPFLTINAWTGLWICALLCLAAFVDLNRMVKHLTRFTDEIFASLIAAIFIIDAIGNPLASGVGVFWYFSPGHQSHVQHIDDEYYSHYAPALLSCILTFGTTYGAFYLRTMKHSRFMPNQTWRNLICDFSVVINILIWTTIKNTGFSEVPTETLYVPDSFAPTLLCCDASCTTSFPVDCPDQDTAWGRRPWLVNLGDTNGKAWVPMFALIPALLAFILVFLDNGITWHLVNDPSNKLTHGEAFNYDTIVIGIMIGVNSILGLPWLVASTVPTIVHVQALAEKDDRGKIRQVQETRLTHIIIHTLILVTIFALSALKLIPIPVLYGVFLFMGINSLSTNQLWGRFKMLFMQPSRLPDEPFTKYMPHNKVHLFTIIQVFIFICLVVFRSIPQIAIAFPIIVKLCIPIRQYLLPKLFSKEELTLLDAEDRAIKKLVMNFEKTGHHEEAVHRDSQVIEKAAFDFADEDTRI